MSRSARHLKLSVTLVVLLLGAFGAPIIGPLREEMQRSFGISRFVFGAAASVIGIAAGGVGMGLTRTRLATQSPLRVLYLGIALLVGGLAALVASPYAGGGLALALGWFLLMTGFVLAGIANVIAAALSPRSAERGILLLHGYNGIGKVLAPFLVLLIGASVSANAGVFLVVFAGIVLHLALVRPAYGAAAVAVDAPAPALSGAAKVRAAMFGFIAGSEAAITSVLGSFVAVHRASALAALDPDRAAALSVLLMQAGVLGGRFFFHALHGRLGDRRIIAVCLVCLLFVLPAVLVASPWVYLPSVLGVGVAFSGPYPCYFSLSLGALPASHRPGFALTASAATVAGVYLAMFGASAIASQDARLALSVIAGALVLIPFAVFFAVSERRPRPSGAAP